MKIIHKTQNLGVIILISIALPLRGVQLTSLASFAITNGSGSQTSLTLAGDGNYYGTTYSGGSQNRGTVFKITTNGVLTSLISFVGVDAEFPSASLTLGSDGNLYGTTYNSSGTDVSGTIFKITTNGMLTTLSAFAPEIFVGGITQYTNANGAHPRGRLTPGNDGYFYGTTASGGLGGAGTVYKVTTNGTLTSLVSFDALAAGGADTYPRTNVYGCDPGDLTLSSDGNFYGAAGGGGRSGCGTIFKVTANGVLTSLLSFDLTNGPNPNQRLTLGNDGCFYGTTLYGGTNGLGTVFKVTTNGMLTTLVAFGPTVLDDATGHYTNANGWFPGCGLTMGADGNLYGTTEGGGSTDSGTIFKVTANGVLTTLFTFGSYITGGQYTNATGAEPQAALLLGPDGSFYGTTFYGGIYACGTVFKLDVSTLASIPLSISKYGNQLVLTWTNVVFSLQSAPDLTGFFTNVPGAASPYTNPLTGPQQFFRLSYP